MNNITTLALLQNQWVKNPEKAKRYIERYGERYRRKFVQYALFAGCLTGRRLKKVFDDRIDNIIWDDVSKEISGRSDSTFPPNIDHVRTLIDEYHPDIIIVFGKIAEKGLPENIDVPVIRSCHPAARSKGVLNTLQKTVEEYDGLVAKLSKEIRDDEYSCNNP